MWTYLGLPFDVARSVFWRLWMTEALLVEREADRAAHDRVTRQHNLQNGQGGGHGTLGR